jgi:hypothetical protein
MWGQWIEQPGCCLLLRAAGFEVQHIWGGTAGTRGRRKAELDEIEIMIVGRKCDGVV